MIAAIRHPSARLTNCQVSLPRFSSLPSIRKTKSKADLASTANQSRSAFAARFKAVVDQSPLEFLTQHRMHKACELMNSGLSIAEVANRVGYDSEISFARAFKRVLGRTPGAFKRRFARHEGGAMTQHLPQRVCHSKYLWRLRAQAMTPARSAIFQSAVPGDRAPSRQ